MARLQQWQRDRHSSTSSAPEPEATAPPGQQRRRKLEADDLPPDARALFDRIGLLRCGCCLAVTADFLLLFNLDGTLRWALRNADVGRVLVKAGGVSAGGGDRWHLTPEWVDAHWAPAPFVGAGAAPSLAGDASPRSSSADAPPLGTAGAAGRRRGGEDGGLPPPTAPPAGARGGSGACTPRGAGPWHGDGDEPGSDGVVTLVLGRDEPEWSLGLDLAVDTLRLASVGEGSVAARTPGVARCVGMKLYRVNGEHVRSLHSVAELSHGRERLRLDFVPMDYREMDDDVGREIVRVETVDLRAPPPPPHAQDRAPPSHPPEPRAVESPTMGKRTDGCHDDGWPEQHPHHRPPSPPPSSLAPALLRLLRRLLRR
eukprot:gene10264-22360_t